MEDAELTIYQAADMLNTSMEWVDGLVSERAIPCRMIDNRPVLMLSDVMRYRSDNDTKRRAVLDELTAEAQSMGFYESR